MEKIVTKLRQDPEIVDDLIPERAHQPDYLPVVDDINPRPPAGHQLPEFYEANWRLDVLTKAGPLGFIIDPRLVT
jgi:hypothetical protein